MISSRHGDLKLYFVPIVLLKYGITLLQWWLHTPWVWGLTEGKCMGLVKLRFHVTLGDVRLHSIRLPSGSNIIRYQFTDLTNCERSIKLNFSDSPAYYTTVLHKYNSPAVFCEKTPKKARNQPSASEVTSKHCRRFPVLATFCFMIGQATSGSR